MSRLHGEAIGRESSLEHVDNNSRAINRTEKI